MTKKTKRQFHCERCGNACEIYKKGKKHRVLVCPECGVIATNPLPLAGLALGLGGKVLKKAGQMTGLVKKDKSSSEIPQRTIIKDEKGKYEYKEKLLAEALR